MMRSVVFMTAVALAACSEDAQSKVEPAAGPASNTTASQARQVVGAEIREFRDWRAVCDNGNACVAWTGSPAGGWIRIAMDAGPEARPTVSVGSWGLGEAGDDPQAVRLRADGRILAVHGGPEDAANAAAGTARAREVIAGVAAARNLALTSGPESVELPSAGASAALLWIDERQGRLETTTALLRRGDRPARAVPAAPALPAVRRAPPVPQGDLAHANAPMGEEPPAGVRLPAAIEALAEVKACREESNEYLDKAVLAGRLDRSTVLWGVPCGSGAYNATYVLYLARPDGTGVRAAELPRREPRSAEEGDLWLVNPEYDPEAQTLTVFPRGRGLGDCGTIQTWTWTAQGFALTGERFMGDCWGMTPDLWPTTWRADVGS